MGSGWNDGRGGWAGSLSREAPLLDFHLRKRGLASAAGRARGRVALEEETGEEKGPVLVL